MLTTWLSADNTVARNGPGVVAIGGNGVLCQWRFRWPLDALAAQGYPAAWATDGNDDRARALDADWCQVIALPLLHPLCFEADGGEAIMASFRQLGKTIVVDVDDDIISPGILETMVQTIHCGRRNPLLAGADWTAQRFDEWRSRWICALRATDGITASTTALAEVLAMYTDRPVVVVPNVLDVRRWRQSLAHAPRRISAPVIGWAGACRPAETTEPIATAWAAIAQHHPRVTFVTVGCCPEPIEQSVPSHRLFKVGYVDMEAWPGVLAEIDIMCAAATDSAFDRGKSPIKAFEAGGCGSVFVGTPALYGPEVISDGDGLLATTATEWEAALERLIDNAKLRRRLARARSDRVRQEHHIERSAWRWVEAWRSIIDQALVSV